MASIDQRLTVIEAINEARRLIGLNTVTTLTQDKQCAVHLRLLNSVVSKISNAGDWQEMFGSANVTARASVREYSIGVKHPVKNIFEVAVSGRPQSLDRIGLSDYLRYSRAGGVGTPTFYTIKEVDAQTNPQFAVHPQPSSAQAGNLFGVVYYKKPPLYLHTDADQELPFAGNLVMAGLYAAVLEEEAGGVMTKESTMAAREFIEQIQEELNRYDSDSGSDTVQLVPGR